jgi:SAM-dependent methyltransferase
MDIRKEAAKFYDHQSFPIDDVDFYISQLPSPKARVLELGCGTGRVLLPLSNHCAFIQGIDISEGMLEVCRGKLAEKGIPQETARADLGDISDLDLGEQFDLIIAPFRVFQNLAEDEQVDGFFKTIKRHLAPGGKAIVNTFRPYYPPEEILERNSKNEVKQDGEQPHKEGRLVRTSYARKPAILEGKRLVFFPNLVYQYFVGDALIEESVMKIAMRVWYSEQLVELVERQGFEITEKWGGYQGEVYGEGPEQVIAFKLSG